MINRQDRDPGYTIPTEILLRAYAEGIFPMAEDASDPEVFWVRPERRGIIPLDGFHVPRSLRRAMRRQPFEIRRDCDFAGVIEGCASARRKEGATWINDPIRRAYARLFELGYCHTVEAWQDGRLVGGLYGVSLGRAFFGESMFSHVTDASKICLVHLVDHLSERGFTLLDTQFVNDHLLRFGAIEVPRQRYEAMLNEALQGSAEF